MNLHEYQGKKILHSYGITIPSGIVIETPEQAVLAAEKIYQKTFTKLWAVKAQIKAGGRSKAGGVRIAKSLLEIKNISTAILGIYLVTLQTSKKGKFVRKLLIEQYVYLQNKYISKEYYLSILVDRYKGNTIIIYSIKGGINIEEVAKKEKEKIFMETIDYNFGIQEFQIRKIADSLEIDNKQIKEFIINIYNAYKGSDASLIEINPLLKTSVNNIIAVDTKIILDDNAFYRHINYLYMCNIKEENPLELYASKAGFTLIKLYGNIGCMVNGAGLAMATMDIIKLAGGRPANFLDIGGSADSDRVEKAIRLLFKDKDVSIIFINIFGGIVRCDQIAKGIIAASQGTEQSIPLIIKLQGTNDRKAKKMINEIHLKCFTVETLQQASEKLNEVL